MKSLGLIILTLLLVESLSVVIKTHQTNLLSKNEVKKGQVQGANMAGYPEMVLRELNYFRRKNHYFPYIRWHNPLAATAAREAQHIVGKHSFGQHANFMNWKKELNSKFFTELSLLVNTEGMMPNKRIFAKTIIEALRQEQEWYLIHAYTQAGVAILPGKKPHHYVVVIHLMRRPSRFHSCKEAQQFGVKENQINIFTKGKKISVKCDQTTVGGGWTRILDMGQQQYGRVIRPIDDLNLHYSELFFKAKPNYYFDYAKGGGGNANNWDFNGYVFSLNCLKFDNIWYLCSSLPSHVGEIKQIPHESFNKDDKNTLQVLKGANKCYFGKTNRPEYCATEFILKKLPKGRLNAISDVESILNKWTGDNEWAQYYEIYLR